MNDTFWSNTIWYILLGISTIIEIVFIFKKAKMYKHIIASFLAMSGIAFNIELTIFCFLRSYDYYPMIIPQSPIDDGLAGNLFSQFSITSTALLTAVLNLKFYWSFIFALIYGIIEELFISLGIYSHNWYKTWITILGITVLLEGGKKMFRCSSIFSGNISRYLLMFFGLYTIHMAFIWWPLLLSGIVGINKKIFSDPLTSYTFISFLNLLILSITCMIVYFSTLKRWLKSIILLMLYGILYLAKNIGIIYIKDGWFLLISTIDIWVMYLLVHLMNRLFHKAASELNN